MFDVQPGSFAGGDSQFALQFFNRGQAALQFLWKALGQPVLGYADRLVMIAKRVLGDEPIPRLAKNDADTRLSRRDAARGR